MDIFLSINNREQVIQLPIIPEEIEVQFANENETFKTIQFGDLNLIGNKGLKSLNIQTFFPNKEYPFAKSKEMTGDDFKESVLMWIDRKVPIRVVIVNKDNKELINMAVSIEGFDHGYDRVGDLTYSLSLKEFPFVGVV